MKPLTLLCTGLFILWTAQAMARESGLMEHGFELDGLQRQYLLYTPQNASGLKGERPLVIALHGGGGTMKNMVQLTKGRWNALADQHGFYVVYPNAVNGHWDFGQGKTSEELRQRVDDGKYFELLVKRLLDRLPVDRSLLFATGHSRGGQASYFIGCKLDLGIRAIAPVSMPLPQHFEDDCAGGPPLGLVLFNGTRDPQVPYNGGPITVLGMKRDVVLSTDETIKLWLRKNNCAAKVSAVRTINPARDQTSVTRMEWSDCEGAPVVLYRIGNGGHTWPSGRQYLPRLLIGRTTRDIDAADEALAFFSLFADKPIESP